MKGRKQCTSEDLYRMLVVALKHPSGGYGGESFWAGMIKKFGGDFFGDVEASTLRSRWRKISKVVV
jgi:hypothetical protein